MSHSKPPLSRARKRRSPQPRKTDNSGAAVASGNIIDSSSLNTPLTFVAVALALWILVSTILLTRTLWVAIPVADDWDRWISCIRDHYSLSWFFQEHVDHRLVVD